MILDYKDTFKLSEKNWTEVEYLENDINQLNSLEVPNAIAVGELREEIQKEILQMDTKIGVIESQMKMVLNLLKTKMQNSDSFVNCADNSESFYNNNNIISNDNQG